jgi:pilus assembly protein CpaB
MKSKQLVLIAIALLCGLVSAIGIIQAMGSGGDVAAEIPHGPVLVASAHMDHKAELSDENVRLENWPLNLIPEGAATDLAEVKGKFITTRLRSGQAVILEDVFNRSEIPGLAIPPGHKVINIKVPPEDLLGGLLSPGDRVDIIGVFNTRSRGEQKSETQTFLKGIRIFNIGSSTSAQDTRKNKGNAVSSIVGVLVTESQSEKIVWARKNGEIRLALIGDMVESEEDPEFNMDNEKEPEPTFVEAQPRLGMDFDRPKKPKLDMSKLRKVKVYSGDQATVTWFDEDGNEVKVPSSGDSMGSQVGIMGMPGGGESESPEVDYEDFDDSDDATDGMEEDQYRGE